MKRNILIPTDFSDNAWNATVYALKLYVNEECKFYFLNSATVIGAPFDDLSNKLLKKIQSDAMKELFDLKVLAETSNANANHDFDIILSTDDLNKSIKKAVEKYNIHLILMGTKGAKGSKEFFFGSNALRVINNFNNCPVLIVPEEYDFIEPKQIAFPTDYNRFYDTKELKPLMELASMYDSKIRILHINIEEELNDIQKYNVKMLQSYLNLYDYSLHWMPKYAKKVTEINDFIEELDINILVMVKYKHNFIEKIINEPVIKKIGSHSNIPFLVIPE